jgi:hypothetical protein
MSDLAPARIRLAPGTAGLYESYYFRGTSPKDGAAFWLKHNLLRYRGEAAVKVECTLILFDRTNNRVSTGHDQTTLDPAQFAPLVTHGDWDTLSFALPSASHFAIGETKLQGALPDAAWNLALSRSNEPLLHFTPLALYRIGWPKKKVLTRDVRVTFEGELNVGKHRIAGTFVGMNGHNWGTEHAHRYAYANCQLWDDGSDAIFDGFSAKVRIAPGVTSPYVTIASLKAGGTWHHFNRLSAVPWNRVSHLSDYRWTFSARNRTHRLEVDIDGANPATRPWVALNYHHPSRALSVVKNTKFATGTIRLVETVSGQRTHELRSGLFELETLLETNTANPSDGFRANAV